MLLLYLSFLQYSEIAFGHFISSNDLANHYDIQWEKGLVDVAMLKFIDTKIRNGFRNYRESVSPIKHRTETIEYDYVNLNSTMNYGIIRLSDSLKHKLNYFPSIVKKAFQYKWDVVIPPGMKLNITFLEVNLPWRGDACWFTFMGVFAVMENEDIVEIKKV